MYNQTLYNQNNTLIVHLWPAYALEVPSDLYPCVVDLPSRMCTVYSEGDGVVGSQIPAVRHMGRHGNQVLAGTGDNIDQTNIKDRFASLNIQYGAYIRLGYLVYALQYVCVKPEISPFVDLCRLICFYKTKLYTPIKPPARFMLPSAVQHLIRWCNNFLVSFGAARIKKKPHHRLKESQFALPAHDWC